jgi:hypothetical protein
MIDDFRFATCPLKLRLGGKKIAKIRILLVVGYNLSLLVHETLSIFLWRFRVRYLKTD